MNKSILINNIKQSLAEDEKQNAFDKARFLDTDFHKSLLGLGYQGGWDWTQGETSVLQAGFLKYLPFPPDDTS